MSWGDIICRRRAHSKYQWQIGNIVWLWWMVQCPAQAYFSFQSYNGDELSMSLVTTSIQGEILLSKGDRVIPLQGAVLDDLFTMRVRIPCNQLDKPTTLYWSVKGQVLQSATVPPQSCMPPKPALPPVKIMAQKGSCMIDTGGNTLWRTATELIRHNGATVYQNIYALFIANRGAFLDDNVLRLQQRHLRCPDTTTFDNLTPDHARRLFSEAEKFNQK